jgi:heme exporter protein B
MWRDARTVAAKDLLIEWRSRVMVTQVLPFVVLLVFLFGFSSDPGRPQQIRPLVPGLFWIGALVITLMATQRAAAIEVSDRALDQLRLAGADGAGVFLGKAIALAAQLLFVLTMLALLMALLLNKSITLRPSGILVIVVTVFTTGVGLAAAGTVYGTLAASSRVRDTLVPLLIVPVVAPLMLGATRAFELALGSAVDEAKVSTVNPSDAWSWVGLNAVASVAFVVAGLLAFESLLED